MRDPRIAPMLKSTQAELQNFFQRTRRATESLCRGLEVEDFVIQAASFASPVRWHLAHTTWFFETFLLKELEPTFRPHHAGYDLLFNSYYEGVGPFFERSRRGTLSRPTVAEIFAYRQAINERVDAVLESAVDPRLLTVLELGIHHEQQHQELLVTDGLYNFWNNPLRPAFFRDEPPTRIPTSSQTLRWEAHPGGETMLGHDATSGTFAFDNEGPRHRALLAPFRLASRPSTNGEFREFVDSGGYREAKHWLSDGWQTVRQNHWHAPLYWEKNGSDWWTMTPYGMRKLDPHAPVTHVSYFEADAFARWQGARLPTEAEWESVAAHATADSGNFAESGVFRPLPATPMRASDRGAQQLLGDVWEWTMSAYLPYPGSRPLPGALGEYNAKFMCNQLVLRGGSCATPTSHIRSTYRNYFNPDARWQFSGIRLAHD